MITYSPSFCGFHGKTGSAGHSERGAHADPSSQAGDDDSEGTFLDPGQRRASFGAGGAVRHRREVFEGRQLAGVILAIAEPIAVSAQLVVMLASERCLFDRPVHPFDLAAIRDNAPPGLFP